MVAPASPASTRLDPFANDPRWALISGEPYPLLIGGELRQAADGRTFDAVSPRDNRAIARIAQAGPEDVRAAVSAARDAFDNGPWGRTTARQRAKALELIARTIEEHSDELIFLSVVDAGSVISGFKQGTIDLATDSLRFFGGQAMAMTGHVVQVPDPGVHHYERLEPMGVVTEILPWNGPIWTGVQRMAAILAAGNTVIVKPAQMASLAFARLAQLMAELDIPPGVINVLSGPGGAVGEALVDRSARRHGEHDRRHRDWLADPDPGGATGEAHQPGAGWEEPEPGPRRRGPGSHRLLERPGRLRQHRPDLRLRLADPGPAPHLRRVPLPPNRLRRRDEGGRSARSGDQVGPVISESHADKVWEYIEIGKGEARLATGGVPYTDEARALRTYIPPTIFADTTPSCRVMNEEIFGPVVAVTAFDTIDEGLRIANDTSYGLASGVFTTSVDAADYVAARLKAGQVYVNQWFSPGVLEAPSHGYKQSGYGGVGMRKYLQSKNVFTRVVDPT